jgi:hypothetical protein
MQTSEATEQASPSPWSVLDDYCTDVPSAANAIEIFEGQWSSVLPARLGVDSGGFASLFEDPRIEWMVEQLGGVEGWSILELGPLEGGHTYALEATYGAAEIVAVEANRRAYLKCLVAKELLGTTRSRFLLGDANRYLAGSGRRFDLAMSCGLLYHMDDPARHIRLLCEAADAVFVWTHYHDQQLLAAAGPRLTDRFAAPTEVETDGYRHRLHRHEYLDALGWDGFCGAGRTYANWMELPDILALFERYGFTVVATGFEHPDHPNGPALAFVARRNRRSAGAEPAVTD